MSQRTASPAESIASGPSGSAANGAAARTPLPVERVFVVQFMDGVHAPGSSCRGQVEHVLSGRRKTFVSAAELLLALGLDADL
ncbi:hypothetical protein [Piscinibacter sp.]|uniref:hypothetical protein n=1 Tax=Piscinibacter sp. TaxID=1903157 RepID=UPI002B77E095|nr:hypothetical protein [Albitalea sp.]HUG22346.1 hypothetical protein [Albitalea sp.]